MNKSRPRLNGLYAITDADLIPPQRFSGVVEAALAGGAGMIQYRDKSTDKHRRLKQASALSELCAHYAVPLIINDDVELAAEVGADGVHLGRTDPMPAKARKRLGPHAIVGLSCYASLDRAQQGEAEGVDYVAFGRFFASATKPGAGLAPVTLLREARRAVSVPIAAIGGIDADNGGTLIRAGAHMLAVVRGVFAANDTRAAARSVAALFRNDNSRDVVI